MGLQYELEHYTENYIMKKLKIKLLRCSDDLNGTLIIVTQSNRKKERRETILKCLAKLMYSLKESIVKYFSFQAQLPRIITNTLDS